MKKYWTLVYTCHGQSCFDKIFCIGIGIDIGIGIGLALALALALAQVRLAGRV